MNFKQFLNEMYYDKDGNLYPDDIEDISTVGMFYLNDNTEKLISELTEVKEKLTNIVNVMEKVGPVSEEIFDAIDAIDKLFDKWENSPMNKEIKKYNL